MMRAKSKSFLHYAQNTTLLMIASCVLHMLKNHLQVIFSSLIPKAFGVFVAWW